MNCTVQIDGLTLHLHYMTVNLTEIRLLCFHESIRKCDFLTKKREKEILSYQLSLCVLNFILHSNMK